MSGGAFDYQQYRLQDIAEEIDLRISEPDHGYRPETVAALKDAVNFLRIAQVYAQRADWMFSGDDGEDSFHERLKSDLAKLEEEPTR